MTEPVMFESFPRMWDQLFTNPPLLNRFRIIPTYVGSTLSSFCGCYCLPNHSHVCGINPTMQPKPIVNYESFPRMWDQLNTVMSMSDKIRIIPTYVGSTYG